MDNTLMASEENKLFTLLYFDGITLAFAQHQGLSIENMEQVNSQSSKPNSTGTLTIGELNLPVYTLDKNLNLLHQTAPNNCFCIVINNKDIKQSIALSCDSVKQNISEESSTLKTIPPLMYNSISPLVGLLNIDHSLVLVSSEEKMINYINTQEQKYV